VGKMVRTQEMTRSQSCWCQVLYTSPTALTVYVLLNRPCNQT